MKRQGSEEPGMWSRQSCGAHCQCGCGGCKFSFCRHGMRTSWPHRVWRLDAESPAVKSWAGVHGDLFPCRSAPAAHSLQLSPRSEADRSWESQAHRSTEPGTATLIPAATMPDPQLQSTPCHSLVIWDEHKREGCDLDCFWKLHEHIHRSSIGSLWL